ncbi:MAG: folK [Bacteroidota bacterium]|jgi:2-amino-4-hydroxy-6-hydroxymethyldihydropteridine diphosphokinase|nr:folK [Bacteroidota bacterium]
MMNIAYLTLGGNIGDRLKNLETAREAITISVGNITKKSDVFITAAWGNTNQPEFYNQALEVQTQLSPSALLEELLKIEAANGRIRTSQKWTERTIDIDILFYNDEVISEPHLHIPHPHLEERKFVLAPLAQIAGDYTHPRTKKNVSDLLRDCKDQSAIAIIESTV